MYLPWLDELFIDDPPYKDIKIDLINKEYKTEVGKRIKNNLIFWKLRVKIKRLLLKHGIRPISFCKMCGIDVRDFLVSNELWSKVEEYIEDGHTLCYNCFIDICALNDIKFDLNEIDKNNIDNI